MNNLMREQFRVYMKCADQKYHVIGKNASEGTLSFGTTSESKNSITNELAKSVAKKGVWSLPISTIVDADDPTMSELLKETLDMNVSREYEILMTWEFMHKDDDVNFIKTHMFKAVVPLSEIGGTGQAELNTSFTIANSGDIKVGYVDVSEATGIYNAATDTYLFPSTT